MPEVFEQALLLYILTTKNQHIDQSIISMKSKKSFIECLRILKECRNDKEIAKPLLNEYRNTYLYYVLYNSPFIRKIQLKKRKEQYYQ
jgi:hypothetical protein